MTIAVIALREEAAKHPPGSTTAGLLNWADIELGDRAERIFELEDELKRLQADCDKYRTAMGQSKEALQVVAKHLMLESYEISADDFARDFAPFHNLMVANSVEPYFKPKKSRKVASA